jgi:NAD-dependent deacetylase
VLPEVPPRCPHCGGLARPNIIWFGESLRESDITAALQATACDVFLTVGTSAIVYPAAGLVHEAKARGAFTAEINPDTTTASGAVDLAIHGGAEDVLPRVEAALGYS